MSMTVSIDELEIGDEVNNGNLKLPDIIWYSLSNISNAEEAQDTLGAEMDYFADAIHENRPKWKHELFKGIALLMEELSQKEQKNEG